MAVFGGSVWEAAAGACHVGGPGSTAIKPAGEPHADSFGRNGLQTFTLELDDQLMHDEADLHRAIGTYRWIHGGPLWAILRQLADDLSQPGAESAAVIEGAAVSVMDYLNEARPERFKSPPRWLRDVEDYLVAHSSRTVQVRDIAAHVGVHHSHLHRVFGHHYRCSIGEFVRRVRVQRATRALCSGDLPLVAVAQDCGFADQPHMTRVLREWIGMTPRAFRESRRLNQ